MNRGAKVKNRAPAPIQITAEQIVREAKERVDKAVKAPREHITDLEELKDYQMRKRKEYEDQIRKQRQFIGNWLKYAKWEAEQNELDRARSVYERALDVDYKSVQIWLRYSEMEMKGKNINHARNVYDRAVNLLPRVDQLWYKYAYMEEMIGNYDNTRNVFEKWMHWEPDEQAWLSYIKFEERCSEFEKSRDVYERYIAVHSTRVSYVRYAKWEARHAEINRARHVYERSLEELEEYEQDEELFIKFSEFEIGCHEYERARVIFKFALEKLDKDLAQELYKSYISFEKQHGDRKDVENVILDKRRQQYEDNLESNPHNYDVWFDYIRLEEADGDAARIREIYERAISNIPPVKEKRFWKRYIYLWINYAIYEELSADDINRTREVYKACLKVIPHSSFTFAKIWVMFAHFEVRQKQLDQARKILGQSIGRCPKDKLFTQYIQLEYQLGNVDRCRKIYEKYLEYAPHNCSTWKKYCEMESEVGEDSRCRALYELAIAQPLLDMPEMLWKSYIDFEISQGNISNTRNLYERLLDRTQHVKVFISFAKFENEAAGDNSAARAIFTRAYSHLKDLGLKEERVLLLEGWQDFEQSLGEGNQLNVQAVLKKKPRKVKKTKPIVHLDGSAGGYEEYYDWIFPDDKSGAATMKLLQMAKKWKKKETGEEDEEQDIANVAEDKEEIDIDDL